MCLFVAVIAVVDIAVAVIAVAVNTVIAVDVVVEDMMSFVVVAIFIINNTAHSYIIHYISINELQ